MKIKNLVVLFVAILILNSCEIVQEINFNEDGSGKYNLGFDMSEMMKMGGTKSDSTNQQIDTIIVFAKFLEEKKDSIAKLSKEEQEKINLLKDFDMYIKSDTVTKQLKMNIGYTFKNANELEHFHEKLKDQNIKELDLFGSKIKSEKGDDKKGGIPNLNEAFTTTFSKKKFTRKITAKALADAIKKKDTSMKKDNPMSDMIRFKQRFTFPYKIKSVSNKNTRILPDFKGIEQEANMYDLNYNPNYFDVEVEFED
ncbi:MAG TPA: hypothetical protein DDZ39_05385 [Flavobacteriaceae bacterium]|jgi:hypothetical protein|nr:hypothetical protein [Flavobacteriaceae bacterium]